MGSCAVVATASVLGAQWLSQPLLHVPAGLWLVGASLAAWGVSRVWGSTITIPLPSMPALPTSLRSLELSGAGDPVVGLKVREVSEVEADPRILVSGVSPASAAVSVGSPGSPTVMGGVSAGLSLGVSAGRPDRVARVGVDLPTAEADALREAAERALESPAPVEVVRVEAGVSDEADCARAGVLALVRRSARDGLRITVPELKGREAGWYDWSRRLPLGYASVFPARVDPALVTLEDGRIGSAGEADVILRLAASGGALARASVEGPSGRGELAEAAAAHALALARRVERSLREGPEAGPALRSAARAAGAWLTTFCGQVHAEERRRLAQACAQYLAEEPEALLRQAAAEIADCEDEAGLDSLARAARVLRETHARTFVDPMAFVHAELSNPDAGDLTLGRIAAGLALVWGTTPRPDDLLFLHEDLLDDLKHVDWLIGREPEHLLLRQALRRLDEAVGVRPMDKSSAVAA